jgi:hypothetical protein
MTLEENIKNWVILDNKIKQLNDEIKTLKGQKTSYNHDIIEYIYSNNLENATIKIRDGKLKFNNTNYPQPLTYKFLYECLNKFFKNDEQSSGIIAFIKSEREIKTIKEIKRFY